MRGKRRRERGRKERGREGREGGKDEGRERGGLFPLPIASVPRTSCVAQLISVPSGMTLSVLWGQTTSVASLWLPFISLTGIPTVLLP